MSRVKFLAAKSHRVSSSGGEDPPTVPESLQKIGSRRRYEGTKGGILWSCFPGRGGDLASSLLLVKSGAFLPKCDGTTSEESVVSVITGKSDSSPV